MPKLSELTDVNYTDPMGAALPVENPFPELQRVYVNEPPVEQPSAGSRIANSILNKLFRSDDQRYQLWPEKIVREGLTAAGDVVSGKVPTFAIDPVTGDAHTSPEMIEKAQAVSALAGTGGLAGGAEGAVLNATPSLRPALKHKERLYKGKPGQEHQDIIPDALYNDFQKKALAGQDLAEYNFGFINDKGHFMTREDALKYGIDNGIIDPHSGKFGALTTTLLSDSSKPGVAIEAMAKANPFFSALEHNVANISQGKMNGEAWLGTLSNKPGVKPEELDWTGLRSFLEENKGKPVTKQQIEAHLAENKIELGEVVKDDVGGAKYINATDRNPNKPRYADYQLPGGENYREVLMTLPNKLDDFRATQKANDARIRELRDSMHGTSGSNEIRAEISKLQNENQAIQQQIRDMPLYKSSHWDEPNILAHMRMNDRTIDGKKSLHIEEIQSDWHQQGRDKGYALSSTEKQRWEAVKNKADKDLTPQDYKDIDDLGKRAVISGLPPDAPFKKTWHELALKRAIREAAEKGYDRLSWTPGEAQAARYDLSKQVDKLSAKPVLDQHGLKYEVKGWKGDNDHLRQVVSETELPNVVGKEMAQKIIKESEGKKPVEFKGLDLKIGGEGMKGFYDSMIPKAIEKLGKEHGVKVVKGQTITHKGYPENLSVYDKDVNHVKDFKTMAEARAYLADPANGLRGGSIKGNKEVPPKTEPVYYIDIPQSLRDTATGKGFPLFAKGGYMLNPVDYEPEFK